MGYRDDHQQPPACPTCKQPAVIAEPMFGFLRCPEMHDFDWPNGYRGDGLPGFAGLRACECGATSWDIGYKRIPITRWRAVWLWLINEPEPWADISLACTKCGRPFHARG
jgi:hypothetical protein